MDIDTLMYSSVTGRDEVFKIPFDFDPAEHKTAKAAATAFHKALRKLAADSGHNPDIEVRLLSPEEAERFVYGPFWTVVYEAGPYDWGVSASMQTFNRDAGWHSEPYHSFDLSFYAGND